MHDDELLRPSEVQMILRIGRSKLYEMIARDLGEQCGVIAELAFGPRISGPLDGDDDLFSPGAVESSRPSSAPTSRTRTKRASPRRS